MGLERLQKIIARAGVTSRRKAEQLILNGKVKVNGKVVKQLGSKADPHKDYIKVDGKLLHLKSCPRHYFLAYKPINVITSLSDPQNRPTIADMLRVNRIRVRVYPVGRLDWDAEGLLLLTNDGEFANQVMHPKSHLPKVYKVKIKGNPSMKALQRVKNGLIISPGVRTLPAKIEREKQNKGSMWLQVTIVEGRKNQIKKMFEYIGHPVCKLKRIAIGPLHGRHLKPGEIRRMTAAEFEKLKHALQKRVSVQQ